MKIKKILIFIAIVVLIALITTKIAQAYNKVIAVKEVEEAQVTLQQKIDAMTTVELIEYIAPQYGQDIALQKKINWCESHHDETKIHDGGHGQGSTGFHRKTFEGWKIEFGHPDYVYESNYDQIALMAEAFSKGEEYRRAWTTYRAYMNGGTYSFHSNLLDKDFTVTCK
jgi:hypothetical protein